MEDISCIMNNEPREKDLGMKHCGKKLVSRSFIYEYQGISLLWKGHLYNRSIEQKQSFTDPICVIRYYLKNGIYKTLRKLNGDFSFILFDPRITEDESILYVATDIFGMFPLFSKSGKGDEIHITEHEKQGCINRRFSPACYSQYFLSHKVHSLWTLREFNTPYYIPPIPMPLLDEIPLQEVHNERIKNTLLNNVQRRLEAYGLTEENATIVLLLEEQINPLFQILMNSVKKCGITPLLCSKEDPLLHEENEYSQIFVLSLSKRLYEYSFYEKHTVLYPCVDVFYLQLHILLGFYY